MRHYVLVLSTTTVETVYSQDKFNRYGHWTSSQIVLKMPELLPHHLHISALSVSSSVNYSGYACDTSGDKMLGNLYLTKPNFSLQYQTSLCLGKEGLCLAYWALSSSLLHSGTLDIRACKADWLQRNGPAEGARITHHADAFSISPPSTASDFHSRCHMPDRYTREHPWCFRSRWDE